MIESIKYIFKLIQQTLKKFGEDRAVRYGAAISYYTIFSLPPILIIITNLLGVFVEEAEVQAQLLSQMQGMLGEESTVEIQKAIQNISKDKNSVWATMLGIGTLIFGATGVFYTLQDSLNAVWNVQPSIKRGILKLLVDRVLSFAMILSVGFILLVSMIINTLIATINSFLHNAEYMQIFNEFIAQWLFISDTTVYVAFALDIVVTLFIISLVFAMIFKFLPDAKVHWRDVWVGAILTAILFSVGELFISWFIGNSDVASMYGAAGSIVVILIWVFYSAQIMLLGAEFTAVYAYSKGREIVPSSFAVMNSKKRFEIMGSTLKKGIKKGKKLVAKEPKPN